MIIHPHERPGSDPGFGVSLVLAGGVGLGSYQAGACDALLSRPDARPDPRTGGIAGSPVGALSGAMVVGTGRPRIMEALRAYWLRGAAWGPFGPPVAGLRHAANWMSALQTRLSGSLGRLQALGPRLSFSSFHDLAPTVAFLRRTIDFGRLNGGDIRFTVAATDIESGDVVLFDTGKGDRIGIDHLLASCGFLPEFAPAEIGGRLLGDGGLAVDAPFEPDLSPVGSLSPPSGSPARGLAPAGLLPQLLPGGGRSRIRDALRLLRFVRARPVECRPPRQGGGAGGDPVTVIRRPEPEAAQAPAPTAAPRKPAA